MAQFEEIDIMTGRVLNKETRIGTKISEILKTAECKNCKNRNIERFTIYFEMDTITKQIKKYLYCDECNTAYEIQETKISEYLLEPIISTAG